MGNKAIKWEHGHGGYSLKVGTVTPLTLAMMSLSKENVELTDDQMKSFARNGIDYHQERKRKEIIINH